MSSIALRARSLVTPVSGVPSGISSRTPVEGIVIGEFKVRQLKPPAALMPQRLITNTTTRLRLATGVGFQSKHQLLRDRSGGEPLLIELPHRPDSEDRIG